MRKYLVLLFIVSACSSKQKELSLDDKLNLIHSSAINANPFETYHDELVNVDCSQVDQMLYDIFKADQEVRNTGELMEETDKANLIEVLSILKYCGFPKPGQLTSHQSMEAIPLVLQHQPNQNISAYFLKELEKGTVDGVFSAEIWVRIVDRQLMYNGYKQVFGTNFVYGKLYELENPENVQRRRDSAGLSTSFERILDNYGLTLEEALADQFSAEELQRNLVKPNLRSKNSTHKEWSKKPNK